MTDESAPATPVDFDPVPVLATELGLDPRGIAAVVAMLADGDTVPFIARYRKEATGGLDDTQLRTLEERLGYLRELEERRTAILALQRCASRAGDYVDPQGVVWAGAVVQLANMARVPVKCASRT